MVEWPQPGFSRVRRRLHELYFPMLARRRGTDARISESGTRLVDPGRHLEFQLVGGSFAALVFGGVKKGLTARQVSSAEELDLGDVIAYDFQGDGRFDHSTIVTAKDGATPLVNAHTYDVRQRHWDYKDSYAYSPNAKYIFFKINDQFS